MSEAFALSGSQISSSLARRREINRESARRRRLRDPSLDRDYQRKYRATRRAKTQVTKNKWYTSRPAYKMISSARYRSKKMGWPCTVTEADLLPLPTYCPVLGLELDYSVGTKGQQRRNSASLDKLRPELGYVQGNVRVISYMANAMKRDATPEQLWSFARWIFQEFPELPVTTPV